MMERKHVQSANLTFALLVPTAIGLVPYWELSDLALSVLSHLLASENPCDSERNSLRVCTTRKKSGLRTSAFYSVTGSSIMLECPSSAAGGT